MINKLIFYRMIIHSTFLLMVLITFVIAEESLSDNVLFDKRAPVGYQEMQGKKNSASLNSENFGIFKRALMGFQVTKIYIKLVLQISLLRELFNLTWYFDYSSIAIQYILRVYLQGVRGKKNSIINDVKNELFPEDINKRAPMGFQGMRGKKASFDDEYYKRAPMGFQGMRGKKSLEEVSKL